jgi:hypothetical protein
MTILSINAPTERLSLYTAIPKSQGRSPLDTVDIPLRLVESLQRLTCSSRLIRKVPRTFNKVYTSLEA